MSGHTQRQWEGKFFRCGMRCYYCYTPLTLADATKDHLTPISRLGSDEISNIVPACIRCNDKKGALTEAEFREAFQQALTNLTGVAADSLSLCRRDERPLQHLRKESESISWAWRNPA